MKPVSKTQTVGDLLKNQREKQRLSIKEIATQTRIRPKYLEAIELNDFAALPAATFVKAYIKSYARVLKLETQPLLAVLRRDYKESAKGTLVPREFLKASYKKKFSWTPMRFLVISLVSLFVIFFSYVAWQWYQLNRPPSLEILSPNEGQPVAAKVLVEGQTVSDAIILVNSQAVALRDGGFFSTELYFSQEGPTTITVKATDRRGKTSVVQRSVEVKF